MRFWWVNQKQTHRQEIGGGYLWSPKRSARARNQFYENMKVVAPGDIVFCYWETAVRARGVVQSFGYDAPKPDEFGDAGRNWSDGRLEFVLPDCEPHQAVAPRSERGTSQRQQRIDARASGRLLVRSRVHLIR